MSVKTGAVGSNPKIDKLINADSSSLRLYASTTMLNQIMQTSAPVTGNSDQNQVDPAIAEASRKTIRDNIKKMPRQSELPEEGYYIKDFHVGNIIQRYKKAEDETYEQMQGASTLAFAEDEAMKRNGIAEKDRKEFFANYLTLESEYLVEGAMLTCTQAKNERSEIKDPADETLEHLFYGESSKTENPLVQVKNPANDGKKKYATVNDNKKNINIGIFRNCRLAIGSESKVLENKEKCSKYGTCYALMDLCEKWMNVEDGAAYGTAGADFKNCINMLSHLGCYQGGIIFPLNTGQGEIEDELIRVNKEDIISKNDYLEKEEMKINARYIYNFFYEAGWSHNAICGLLGNMQEESNFSPTAWYEHKVNSVAFGLSQWNPYAEYFEWANKNGLDKNDIDAQLEYILLEAEGTVYRWQGFRHESNMSFETYINSEESVEYLAEVYLRCYERPEITNEIIEMRKQYAKEWSDFILSE